MDSSSSSSTSLQQRKNEILAKKQRLADLKRQREARQKEYAAGRTSIGEATNLSPPYQTNNREELDSLISNLVGDKIGTTSDRNVSSEGIAGNNTRSSTPLAQNETTRATSPSNTVAQNQSLSFTPLTVLVESPAFTKAEYITYNRGVQTGDAYWDRRRGSDSSISDDDFSDVHGGRPKRLSRREKEKEAQQMRERIRQELEKEIEAKQAEIDTASREVAEQEAISARLLSEEESKAVMSEEHFLGFVGRASKVIERALDEEYDILADYAARNLGLEEEDEDGYGATKGKAGRGIKEIIQFYDERWSKKRMISDLDFSPKFHELVLASYTKNPAAPNDPDGLIQVWNLHMHDRSEYMFHAQSDILTAMFSPFHPNLIIGGAYSGQVLLWDTRAKSAPVQKTPLTGFGHTHPIYSLDIVGTPNANNIISCSTDGVVCTWTVDMLAQPQEYLELATPAPSRTDEIAPTCLAFPAEDPTYFLAGTEEGGIYPCHRYDRAGARSGIDTHLSYRSHTAPVMSLSFHPSHGPLNLTDLALSSGLDWSVKLWKVRTPSATTTSAAAAAAAASATTTNNPISPGSYSSPTATTSTTSNFPPFPARPSFDQLQSPSDTGLRVAPLADWPRDAPVYSARWSPARPGVFALVDGAGTLEIWDLATDVEEPVVKTQPGMASRVSGGAGITPEGLTTGGGGPGGGLSRSLNKLAWEPSEGRKVAVGGLDGVVSVFEVGSGLGGREQAKASEWDNVKRWVGRLELE